MEFVMSVCRFLSAYPSVPGLTGEEREPGVEPACGHCGGFGPCGYCSHCAGDGVCDRRSRASPILLRERVEHLLLSLAWRSQVLKTEEGCRG